MRLVCLSDTHTLHRGLHLPGGDVLVHTGDMTSRGHLCEVQDVLEWFGSVGHYAHRVLIAGNHDFLFEHSPQRALALMPGSVTYLNDSGAEIGGLGFWGSPITPFFADFAFNRHPHEIKAHWDLIPAGTDVLLTHGPPLGILDQILPSGEHVGCPQLARAVQRVRPQVHLFGHIHEGHGQQVKCDVRYVNASVCDRHYRATNPVTVLDIQARPEQRS